MADAITLEARSILTKRGKRKSSAGRRRCYLIYYCSSKVQRVSRPIMFPDRSLNFIILSSDAAALQASDRESCGDTVSLRALLKSYCS
jgi:hypothetical protein